VLVVRVTAATQDR